MPADRLPDAVQVVSRPCAARATIPALKNSTVAPAFSIREIEGSGVLPGSLSPGSAAERRPEPGEVVVAVAHRMILEHEPAGERRIAVERDGRGAVQL